MFFQNLISKFTLIFTIFSCFSCFSVGADLNDRVDFSDRKEVISKRQKTLTGSTIQIDYEDEQIEIAKILVELGTDKTKTPIKKALKLQNAHLRRDPSFLTPNSRTHYSALSTEFDGHKIVNPNIQQTITEEGKVYTPFIRRYASRTQVREFIETGEVESLPANAFSEYVELPPETENEREIRKDKERKYFLSLNKVDFSTYQKLEEREAAYWISFWQYIAEEKAKVLNSERQKIRPEELENIAKIGPLQHYQSFAIDGTLFYYHLDFLDFSLHDGHLTNAQRLKNGLNPIGIDGKSMEIHHLTMFNDSILVLLSRTCHNGSPLKKVTNDDKATFHPQPTYYGRGKNSDIDRVAFAKITSSICKKLGEMSPPISIGTPPIFPLIFNGELDYDYDFDLDCAFVGDESKTIFPEEDRTSGAPILENNDEEGSIFYIPIAGVDSSVPTPQQTFLPKPMLLVDNNAKGTF